MHFKYDLIRSDLWYAKINIKKLVDIKNRYCSIFLVSKIHFQKNKRTENNINLTGSKNALHLYLPYNIYSI